jgi:putative glutamine amidotransferase
VSVASRPRIGVVVDYHEGTLETHGGDEAHAFLNARYVRAVEAAGGRPWLLSPPPSGDPAAAEDYLAGIDGLLLTGCGRHLDPKAYGETARFDLTLMPRAKQELELALVKGALARGVPLLAVCGGMQSMNVALGGTLFQRIGAEVPGALEHMQKDKATISTHPVQVAPGSILARVTGAATLQVNSSHTQAVRRAGDDLTVSATAPDGVVEAVEYTGPVWAVGVQWHPEYLGAVDPAQARLFTTLVAQARGREPARR